MIGVDTNILLRLFTSDSPSQTKAVVSFLTSRETASVRVSSVVLAELAWVLRSTYRLKKPEIIEILREVLERAELTFEGRGALVDAIELFKTGKADFADCLIAATNKSAGATTTMTFDKASAELPVFTRLHFEE